MKTTIYILSVACLLLPVGGSNAQPRKTNAQNLDAYVGIWEYRNGTEYFQVVLKKGRENTWQFVGDCIVGGYLYQNNGQTIASYTHSIPLEYNESNERSIKIQATNGMGNPEWVNPNKLRLYFYDEKVGYRTMHGLIELVSSTQIRWILRHPRSEFSVGPPAERDQYTVPTDVVLTKVVRPPVVPDPPRPPDEGEPGSQTY